LIDAWKFPRRAGAQLDIEGVGEKGEERSNSTVPPTGGDGRASSVKELSDHRRRKFLQKYQKLNERFIELIEDFSLVAFVPMSVKKPNTMIKVVRLIDKSNGYVPTKPSVDSKKGTHGGHEHHGGHGGEDGGNDEEDMRNKIASLRDNVDSWNAIDDELEDAYLRGSI
jgi:hypothetical protein